MLSDREGVVVRAARATDAAAITSIFAHYVRHTVITFAEKPPTEEEWTVRIGTDRMPFLVAEVDGAVVGFATVIPWRSQDAYRHTVENAVYVAEGNRSRGIGSALLGGLIEASRAEGHEQMVAVIAVDSAIDDASVRLHRRCGFRIVGTLEAVGRKHGRRIDTLLMQLDLGAPDLQGR